MHNPNNVQLWRYSQCGQTEKDPGVIMHSSVKVTANCLEGHTEI